VSVVPQQVTAAFDFLGHSIGNGENEPGVPMQRARAPIVAELGINHNGSEDIAHKMIDVAKACGADIVKLQRRDLATTYQTRYLEAPDTAPGGLAHYLPVLKRCELPAEAYPRLQEHAERLGLGFLVTPFDEPSVDFLEGLGVKAYKVASCDATNPLLLRRVAATGKPFLVSTGMTHELDVFRAVAYLQSIAGGRFGLMHAVSGYPVPFRDCQLHMILRYKVNHGVPVGWSGHERGVAVSVGAVAAGADVLERHFTLDRTMNGPDHAASLEPDGLKKLVERVRAFEEAFGNPYLTAKTLTRGEEATREVLGKSLVARRAIAAGEDYGWADLEARSPGRGVPAAALLGAANQWTAPRALALGEELRPEDLQVSGERFMVGPEGRASGSATLSEVSA
jgi:sialic acid synthase SpsE